MGRATRATGLGCALLLLLLLTGVLLSPATAKDEARAWRKRLAGEDPEAAYATILEIGRARDITAALPLLEFGAQATHPHLALACGEALAQMRAEDVDAKLLKDRKFKSLWRKLTKERKPGPQRNIARVLGAWGHPHVDAHLADLAGARRDSTVRIEALLMAGGLGRGDDGKAHEATRRAIEEAVRGRTSGRVTAAACSAAGRRHLVGLESDLRDVVLQSAQAPAGLYAVQALGRLDYAGGVVPFAKRAAEGPAHAIQQACLKAITELASPKDVKDLVTLFRHSNKDLRDAAVLALGRMAWRSSREKDQQGAATSGAVEAAPYASSAPLATPGTLADPDVAISEETVARLIELVANENDWEVRDAARQALLRFGGYAQRLVGAHMPSLVRSSDYDTALTAMELCGTFKAEAAYKDLLKVVLHDKDRTRRMFAARALEGVDPVKAVAELTKSIQPRSQAKESELRSVRALGYLRHDAAFDWLVGLVRDGDYSEAMLREGHLALERLTGHRFGSDRAVWRAWKSGASHPYRSRIPAWDRAKLRREVVTEKRNGITPATERAVEIGLGWLAAQQHPLGFWDGSEKGLGGVINCEPAYTGLSLLAFLGAGYSSASGKYRETIRRALETLAATQLYDGSYPVGRHGDNVWIFAYLNALAIWGLTDAHGLLGDETLAAPAQWGLDYLVRVQTPGAGWRYTPRHDQSDTSSTACVLSALCTGARSGLDVAQRSWDGIDAWLERCQLDVTGLTEDPEDLGKPFDGQVGGHLRNRASSGYFESAGSENLRLQTTSMTAVGMVCRFFMGWKRSHPFMVGSANYLMDYLPRWMQGLEKGMTIAWYHYYWYYGTLAMYQMGGRYWRAWNQKMTRMYTEKQRTSPEDLRGSWDPDTAILNGGRLFSTAMSILSLETWYIFPTPIGMPR